MSRHDGKSNAYRSYTRQLHRAMSSLLPRQGLRLLPKDDKERWTPRYLVIMALLMSCLGVELLVDRFHTARGALIKMYPTRRRPGSSYAGFVNALSRLSKSIQEELMEHLRDETRRIARERWRIDGWLVFGGDGSRFDKTRTTANKEAFGRGGREKTGPQQFVTTLFHVATGLPWCWQAGNADASERDQLREMLHTLPSEAMLLLDAGYSGYDLLKTILKLGHSFIIRVGANVRLMEGLGWHYREENGIVYLWPDKERRKRNAPLTLRLVTVIDKKGRQMHLLTSVLDRSKLRDGAVGRMYRLRWEIELLFRTIKQTMQLRKARSWTPDASELELQWGMMGVWMLGLLACEQQCGKRGDDPAPVTQWSAAEALRIIRRSIRGSMQRGPSLARLLRAAIRDGYIRRKPKKAKDWAHKKREKPPGNPKRRKATRVEIKAAAVLRRAA